MAVLTCSHCEVPTSLIAWLKQNPTWHRKYMESVFASNLELKNEYTIAINFYHDCSHRHPHCRHCDLLHLTNHPIEHHHHHHFALNIYKTRFIIINNGLEFWCVGISHAGRMHKWLITSIRTTDVVNEPIYDGITLFCILAWPNTGKLNTMVVFSASSYPIYFRCYLDRFHPHCRACFQQKT